MTKRQTLGANPSFNLRGMFSTSLTFRLPSRTFLWWPILSIRIGVQHRLSFDDPFKQHNSRRSICCLRQSLLWRMFGLYKTTAGDTSPKERCSIRLAEEPIPLLLPKQHWTGYHGECGLLTTIVYECATYSRNIFVISYFLNLWNCHKMLIFAYLFW